ncbi:TPA_asm: hypothetical protein G0G78_02810 [Salmonella enterica]|nr:hypothetical protein [Salmonella enterica]EHP1714740.1 hypothetical protein [Salmonella enterica subsp. enterica serovar Javiana]EAU3473592.1 hypothetical protein [Salmonella enterica]EAX5428702.1 hypothetical protein [Salmonella enterica]EAY9540884.1 hypothetical protein [Salmonella enterica]
MFFVIGVYIIAVLSAYGYLAWLIVVDGIMTGQLTFVVGFIIFFIGALFIFLVQAMVTPLMYPLAYIAEGIWWLMKKAWHGIIRRRTHA